MSRRHEGIITLVLTCVILAILAGSFFFQPPVEAGEKQPQEQEIDLPDHYPWVYVRCLKNGDRIYATRESEQGWGFGASSISVVGYSDQANDHKCPA